MGEVRIIGGNLKRSRLAVPDRPGLRPTPDRVRETLFNWLTPVIDGARVLDLCAGTGVLGIEALSRGAGFAHFNEPDPQLADLLAANIARLKLSERAQLSRLPAQLLLRIAPAQRFDLIFVDPPYGAGLWAELLSRLQDWLAPGAWLYLEHPIDMQLEFGSPWRVHKQAQAGRIRYFLLEHASGSASLSGQTSAEPTS
jgi:16S rRNA (guanine966-N2)-methyltransferase